MLGHDGPPTNLWSENLLTGKELTECPLRTVLRRRASHAALSDEWQATLAQYPFFEKGVLLVAGGISDQPARWLDMMSLIQETRATTEAKHLAIQRQDAEESRTNTIRQE